MAFMSEQPLKQDLPDSDLHPAAMPRRSGGANPYVFTGLSARLLGLTALFVMLAEVLIFLPSIGRALEVDLRDRVKDADLAIAMLQSFQSEDLDPSIDARLLYFTNALMIARTGDGTSKAIFQSAPPVVHLSVNLQTESAWGLISKALQVLVLRDPDAVMGVSGVSPTDDILSVEMLFRVEPQRQALLTYARNVLVLSLIISLFTAGLVYLALQQSIVRPVRRLSRAMSGFARRPLSSFEDLRSAKRRDELGEASRALASMRQTVRNSLVQNQRLASLGTGMTQINHDLRNLLSTALLLSEQLENSEDSRVRQKMPHITQSIEAAADLCQQTLSFAREGSVMLRTKPMLLSRLMLEIDLQLSARFPQLDLAVTLSKPEIDGIVSLDLTQIERVLANLMTNASQAGANTVWVDAARGTGDSWSLLVSDDGMGFAAHALERLFEPFAGTTKSQGTGLGLYNARDVMRAHDGDLELQDPGPQSGGHITTFALHFKSDLLRGGRRETGVISPNEE